MRHGKAEDMSQGGDFSRELVEEGREQARRAAKRLKQGGLLPDIVLTSPLLRARQTADEFCKTAGMPGAIIQGWLASGMSPETALAELVAFKDFQRVAIVGHEPDFSEFIERTLGASGYSIEVKKGAVACLRMSPSLRGGTLKWLIPPKLANDCEE